MKLIDKNQTVGSVVAVFPEAKDIFSNYGIDYCCGGNRILSNVILEQNIDEAALLETLNEAMMERKKEYEDEGRELKFTDMSPLTLSNYIEDKHHGYLRQVLPYTAELLETILRVHGKNHRELFEVYRLFGSLKSDLEQHLLKEETILFPSLAQPDANEDEIIALTTEIIKEHEDAGRTLSELRRVTNDYNIPEYVCQTFRKTYELLIEIENDLHQHIHLENNILLKKYDHR
jgi:regulator of cell morphogenesis and NO signaling